MADRYTQVLVLCEDLMHLNFVRRYLIERGIEGRRIRGNVAPAGRGAGSQYVLKTYPIEVTSIRKRPHIRAGLVAIVDADTLSLEDRLGQLEQSLVQDGQPGRGEGERIGLLSSKRNIETWLFYLLGNNVNEMEDYKRRVAPSATKDAVAAFAEKCPSKAGEIAVPSLQHACRELTEFLGRATA
jgi:hypothetical protein